MKKIMIIISVFVLASIAQNSISSNKVSGLVTNFIVLEDGGGGTSSDITVSGYITLPEDNITSSIIYGEWSSYSSYKTYYNKTDTSTIDYYVISRTETMYWRYAFDGSIEYSDWGTSEPFSFWFQDDWKVYQTRRTYSYKWRSKETVYEHNVTNENYYTYEDAIVWENQFDPIEYIFDDLPYAQQLITLTANCSDYNYYSVPQYTTNEYCQRYKEMNLIGEYPYLEIYLYDISPSFADNINQAIRDHLYDQNVLNTLITFLNVYIDDDVWENYPTSILTGYGVTNLYPDSDAQNKYLVDLHQTLQSGTSTIKIGGVADTDDTDVENLSMVITLNKRITYLDLDPYDGKVRPFIGFGSTEITYFREDPTNDTTKLDILDYRTMDINENPYLYGKITRYQNYESTLLNLVKETLYID